MDQLQETELGPSATQVSKRRTPTIVTNSVHRYKSPVAASPILTLSCIPKYSIFKKCSHGYPVSSFFMESM